MRTDKTQFELQTLKHEVRRRQRLWQLRGLRDALPARAAADDPVTVYGLFSSASGLGQACRLIANNLERLGRRVFRVDTAPHLFAHTPDPAQRFDRDPGYGPILLHLNPVEAAEIMAAFKPPRLAERPRIALWLYELDQAPTVWADYVELFDRVCSPSEASAAALRTVGADAVLVPYCHEPLSAASTPPNPVFTVLTMADYRSSLARKNVHGAVQAFARAFKDSPNMKLILKIANLPFDHPLRGEIEAVPGVELVERRLSYPATLGMISGADCFLSLHRREGYGLSLVEAMQLGTPVIMTDETTTRPLQVERASVPIPSQSIAVDDPQGVYRGGYWADPDLDAAAAALRQTYQTWTSGDLAVGQPDRIARANAAFCADERLAQLRFALTSVSMGKTDRVDDAVSEAGHSASCAA